MPEFDTLNAIGSAATAAGVLLAAWQIRQSVKQARVDFEDDLNREYRQLMQDLPPQVQFDTELDDATQVLAFPRIYRYFDLSNEQAFLRMTGRVSAATWANWSVGMRALMAKPAFLRAWQTVLSSTSSFSELRRLVASDFTDDPYYWRPWSVRVRRWLAW